MHPKIAMFLRERDRAYARGDLGVIRSLTADLRRLGVPDTATIAHPDGRQSKNGKVDKTDEKRGRGRPPKPRCEHGEVAERCVQCQEAEIAETRESAEAV